MGCPCSTADGAGADHLSPERDRDRSRSLMDLYYGIASGGDCELPTPRPADLVVKVTGWKKWGAGADEHVRYNLAVCLCPPEGQQWREPEPLWTVHRRYQEMAPVFRRLRDFDRENHWLPEVPLGNMERRLGVLSGGNSTTKEMERADGFCRLFNAVLRDPFLSAYPSFHRLLGAPPRLTPHGGLQLRPQEELLDPTVKLDERLQKKLEAVAAAMPKDSDGTEREMGDPLSSSALKIRSGDPPSRLYPDSPPGSPSRHRRSPPASPRSSDPRLFRRWLRVSRLGSGAMGTVWLGLLEDARQVAVKVVPWDENGEITEDDERKRKVTEEFTLLSRLRHRNIVSVFGHHFASSAGGGGGCKDSPGLTFTVSSAPAELHIFMELVPGGSVAQLVGKVGKLPKRVVRTYTRQVLSALAYLHSNAVVHRDIKGANLLTGSDGELKVADFGCSRSLSPLGEESMASSSGRRPAPMSPASAPVGATTMAGTPFWMAPEVIAPQRCGGSYGVKCDIWSLGCVVVEMLGSTPWGDVQAATAWETLYTIANAKTGPTNVPWKDMDSRLRGFLEKCFLRDAQRRPSAEHLLLDAYITCDVEPGGH